MAHREDLELAILADREDSHLYRAYADWLEGEADPRAELIVVHQRIDDSGGTDGKALERAATLLRIHKTLTPQLDVWRARFQWHWGFIVGAALERPSPEEVALVLEHPSCTMLRTLKLDVGSEDPYDIVEQIRQSRPTLEWLEILQDDPDDAAAIPDQFCDALWARVPRLTRLSLDAHRLFFTIAHPHVRELEIKDSVPFAAGRDHVALDLPAVVTVRWEPTEWSDLEQLWRSPLPALRAFDLRWWDGGKGGLLRDARFMELVARIEALTLPLAALHNSDDRARQLLRHHAKQLRHLRELNVFDCSGDNDDTIREVLPNLRWIE